MQKILTVGRQIWPQLLGVSDADEMLDWGLLMRNKREKCTARVQTGIDEGGKNMRLKHLTRFFDYKHLRLNALYIR